MEELGNETNSKIFSVISLVKGTKTTIMFQFSIHLSEQRKFDMVKFLIEIWQNLIDNIFLTSTNWLGVRRNKKNKPTIKV